ncbi:MAG: cytochrome c biogenesis protein [Chloroflexia bacterium]
MGSKRWADVGKWALGLWMVAVLLAAFLLDARRLGTLGQGARIIFFHIPTAWVTVLALIVSSVFSVRYLARRRREDDRRAANSAGLGILFCLLATVTGSIFARITWGAFWNWDPRETTIFVLLLFYAAYFALRAAVSDEETRATFSAAYNILGLVVVPFLVFIAPRLPGLAGLHPEPIVNVRGELEMDTQALSVFLAALAGFTGIYLWTFRLANRLSFAQDRLDALEETDGRSADR